MGYESPASSLPSLGLNPAEPETKKQEHDGPRVLELLYNSDSRSKKRLGEAMLGG